MKLVLSTKELKSLFLIALLIGDVIANPCSRLGCSCSDRHHINCSGRGTISARALAQAVVAKEVWTIDFRYRIFSSIFLGELAYYFTGLKSVRVDGGPCHNIVMFLGGRVHYTIYHNCYQDADLHTTAVLPGTELETTTEVAVHSATTSVSAAPQRDFSTEAHWVSQTDRSTTATAALVPVADTTTATLEGQQEQGALGIYSNTIASELITQTADLSVTTDNTMTDTGISSAADMLLNSTFPVLAVARQDREVEITVHPDGTVTVLVPWIVTVCVMGILILAALLYLCCCKRNSPIRTADPENPSSDPRTSAAGTDGSALVAVNPASAVALLGNCESPDVKPEAAGSSLELGVIGGLSVPVSTTSTAVQTFLSAVTTADLAVQVSISEEPAVKTRKSGIAPSTPARYLSTVNTAEVGLQVSLPTPEDSYNSGENSFLSLGDSSDIELLSRIAKPATSSPIIPANAVYPRIPDNVSIITPYGGPTGSAAAPGETLPKYYEEYPYLGDRSDFTEDLSTSLTSDQCTETSSPSLYLSAEAYHDVRVQAVLRDSAKQRPRDAADAAKVGAAAIARARKSPRPRIF